MLTTRSSSSDRLDSCASSKIAVLLMNSIAVLLMNPIAVFLMNLIAVLLMNFSLPQTFVAASVHIVIVRDALINLRLHNRAIVDLPSVQIPIDCGKAEDTGQINDGIIHLPSGERSNYKNETRHRQLTLIAVTGSAVGIMNTICVLLVDLR